MMKNLLFPLLLGLISQVTFLPTQSEPELVCALVQEQQPEFPGGMKGLNAYLRQTVRYPKEAVDARITGRVFTYFVIDTVGCISRIRVLRGLGYGCDEEAVRVIERMPRWIPGRMLDRKIAVAYTLPINFPPK